MESNIDFAVLGIAEILQRFRLRVPPNQREYSWEAGEVRDLMQDISNAMRTGGDNTYFLGTIVLTKTLDDSLEVADGQQRLATITMILSYVRDYFREKDNLPSANSIENEYLFKYDIKAKDILPRLTLNLDDNEYFRNAILHIPGNRESMSPSRRSHRLISGAVNEIRDHFESSSRQLGGHFQEAIIEW